MNLRRELWVSVVLTLSLWAKLGSASTATLAQSQASLPPCAKSWSKLIPKGFHAYDYSKNEPYSEYLARTQRKQCRKDWAVLVYMAADNDLTPYAYWDLYEMEAGYRSETGAAGSSLKADLLVQFDSKGNRGIRRIHVFQTPEPYRPELDKLDFEKRTEKDIRSPVVETLPEGPEVKESEEDRFRKFLEWGMANYPAEHHLVIVWGHGQGWAPNPLPAQPAQSRYLTSESVNFGLPAPSPGTGREGGIAFNETRGTYLGIPALRDALQSVVRTHRDGKPIDIYASDACLMQMTEVAYEISPAVRFIVGSTQVQDYLGLPYRTMMYALNRGKIPGGDESYQFAQAIPTLFYQSLQPQGYQGRASPTARKSIAMSALSSEELSLRLVPALVDLRKALQAYLAEDPDRALDLQFVFQKAPSYQGSAQELGATLTLLKLLLEKEAQKKGGYSRASEALYTELNLTKDVIQRVVLNYRLGTDYTGKENLLFLLGFKALSMWFPSSESDYQARIGDFKLSRLYRDTEWALFLDALYR